MSRNYLDLSNLKISESILYMNLEELTSYSSQFLVEVESSGIPDATSNKNVT